MEGLTPTKQQDEDRDNLVGGPGPTQSGGGATGSVEKGTMHRNTLATVNASFSRNVRFPGVESQALDEDHRRSGKRNTRISSGREGNRVQSGNNINKPTTSNMSHHRNATKLFPERNLGAPIGGWEEFVSAGGRGRAGLQPGLAVFIGPPQAPWGPVGAPHHPQQGWTPQRQFDTGAQLQLQRQSDTGAQLQPQQGEAPQQQGAAAAAGLATAAAERRRTTATSAAGVANAAATKRRHATEAAARAGTRTGGGGTLGSSKCSEPTTAEVKLAAVATAKQSVVAI